LPAVRYNKGMTTRPVFVPKATRPYYQTKNYEIDWAPGQAAAQKTKNSLALQQAFLKEFPEKKVLEVSTKSQSDTGKALSPFHLTKRLPTLKKEFPLESVYHASKVFKKGGPYVDLLGVSPLQSKRDERLQDSGELVHFSLENVQYPSEPDILFYNWLYINALKEHPALARQTLTYDAFCDIEFNPATGHNCQAKACAIYVSLAKAGLLDQVSDFESFKKIMLEIPETEIKEQSVLKEGAATLNDMRTALNRRQVFSPGQWIDHPSIGKGEVIRKTKDHYLINFKVSGPKSISKEYVERFCKKIS
jgi:type I restriction enzyme M protein